MLINIQAKPLSLFCRRFSVQKRTWLGTPISIQPNTFRPRCQCRRKVYNWERILSRDKISQKIHQKFSMENLLKIYRRKFPIEIFYWKFLTDFLIDFSVRNFRRIRKNPSIKISYDLFPHEFCSSEIRQKLTISHRF